jgi:uncharacterized membrane protein YoaK (UPF0700 family)
MAALVVVLVVLDRRGEAKGVSVTEVVVLVIVGVCTALAEVHSSLPDNISLPLVSLSALLTLSPVAERYFM